MATLLNPTGRKTEARICIVGGRSYYFSYQTCIGFAGHDENGVYHQVRVANSWGPTTGKHFRELGIADWEQVSMDFLEDLTK